MDRETYHRAQVGCAVRVLYEAKQFTGDGRCGARSNERPDRFTTPYDQPPKPHKKEAGAP